MLYECLVPSKDLALKTSSPQTPEGEDARLTCRADEANPTSQITWHRDSVQITEIVEDEYIEGRYNSYTRESILAWTSDRQDNGVTYSCEVEGSNLPQESHKMSVTCKYIYQPLSFVHICVDNNTCVQLILECYEINLTLSA